jgi:hypothetical protein
MADSEGRDESAVLAAILGLSVGPQVEEYAPA